MPKILILLLVFAKMIKKILIARQIQRLQTAIEFQRKKKETKKSAFEVENVVVMESEEEAEEDKEEDIVRAFKPTSASCFFINH